METPSWPNTIFGEQLRQLRKAAGITQEELAFRVSMDRTYISLLERGIKSPTLNTYFRLCKVLNQQPAEVIDRVYQRIIQVEQDAEGVLGKNERKERAGEKPDTI
jgi:transcriptional regulator with XRE-family HTH domain